MLLLLRSLLDQAGVEPPVVEATPASQEVTLRKWYVKRGKRILIFASANDADAFLDSEQAAKDAIEQAQKTSRRARKRFAAKVYTVKPLEEVDIGPLSGMAQHFGMAVDLPALYAQQNYARVLEIYAQAMLLQDEEDVELLLLA